MQVKVFESEDMATGLQKVKEALGPDALILSTRTVRRKGLGILGKPYLEITAAKESPDVKPPPASGEFLPATGPALPEDRVSLSLAMKRSGGEKPSAEKTQREKFIASDGRDFREIREEINQLKKLFLSCCGDAPQGGPSAFPFADGGLLGERLGSLGVEKDVIRTLEDWAVRQFTAGELADPEFVEELLIEAVAELVPVGGPLVPKDGRQLRVALVGPTGVGKTTTVAKLAAEFIFRTRKKVALVTIDTYRIAAVEQLRIYGEIMKIPVEVVLTPEQMTQAFNKHADKDLILIDTGGRNPRDEIRIDELGAFLGSESGVANHLVLAAHTRSRDMEETVSRFGRLPLSHFIFTKLDESGDCGALLNIPLRHNLPVSFLTDGQRVPEDLTIADTAVIHDHLLNKSR